MGHIFSKLPNQCDFGYFGVPNVDTTVIVHVADGGGAQAQLGREPFNFGVKILSFHWKFARNPEKVSCVSGSWSESNLLAGGFNMFSYFWSVANNFQCVDDISYIFIHFMLWLCQRVFSALRVAWSWPNASLSVINQGIIRVVSTQNVQHLARNGNIVSYNITYRAEYVTC